MDPTPQLEPSVVLSPLFFNMEEENDERALPEEENNNESDFDTYDSHPIPQT